MRGLDKIINIYICGFVVIMLMYCSVFPPNIGGEWDDYSLPVASIMNDHNFSISEQDVVYYKELFPDWVQAIDSYSLSGYYTRDGKGEMTWYFPVYSLICVPFTVFLQCINLPAVFAFPYTNLLCLALALLFVNKKLKAENKIKFILILALSLNPIIFYISWISAEVFIYSAMIVGLVCWYNKWYKRAAVFISVAGMLNATIMSIGIVMIIEYLWQLQRSKSKEQSWILFWWGKAGEIIKYGCCYLLGIIPMLYNYYNTGYINLTASLARFTKGNETTFSRTLSYLFDLNYGIIAYFPLILVLSVVCAVLAFAKKKIRYIEWFITFLINVILYSIMTHINCGMSGIARYNVWGVSILLFAIILIGTELFSDFKTKRIITTLLAVETMLTMGIVFSYGPYLALQAPYTSFTPIAEVVLDKFSWCYNPLYSTFNSRTTHVDGGYSYDTPVVYVGKDGYVRKILASEKDISQLLDENYFEYEKECSHYTKQVEKLQDVGYISLTKKDAVRLINKYKIGERLQFVSDDFEGMQYVIDGMSTPESWGTWTNGKKVVMQLNLDKKVDKCHCDINASVYGFSQEVEILVNNKTVYQNSEYAGEGISFDFENPRETNVIRIEINLPSATSSIKFGSADRRALGLGITNMIISEMPK